MHDPAPSTTPERADRNGCEAQYGFRLPAQRRAARRPAGHRPAGGLLCAAKVVVNVRTPREGPGCRKREGGGRACTRRQKPGLLRKVG